jgi:hypothetical protein
MITMEILFIMETEMDGIIHNLNFIYFLRKVDL